MSAVRLSTTALASVAVAALIVFAQPVSAADERTVKIAGWGAKSGPLRSFGVNSEAVLKAAVQSINDSGGVKLGDGTMAQMEFTYYDSACNADQAISVARKVESQTEALIGIGPTCSGAAAAMYGIFQKTVDDESDTGLQFPILTDTAIRPGLAKKSQWTFRNVPNEITMYNELFSWLRTQYPDVKTIYGGTETDQAHSKLTFAIVIVPMAKKHGFEWVGGGIEGVTGKVREGYENVLEVSKSSNWLMADTNFSVQARAFKKSGADMMIVSSHPVHHLRHVEGDEASKDQADGAGRAHQLVQRGNTQGLFRCGGRHVHPDRLRTDHGCCGEGRGGGRSKWWVCRPSQRGCLGECAHRQAGDRIDGGHGQARDSQRRSAQDPRRS